MRLSLRTLMIWVTILCIASGIAAATGLFGFSITISILFLVYCCERSETRDGASIFAISRRCSWLAVVALFLQAAIFTTATLYESGQYKYVVLGGLVFLLYAPVCFVVAAIAVHVGYILHKGITRRCSESVGGAISRELLRAWQMLPRHCIAAGAIGAMYSIHALHGAVAPVVVDWTFAAFALLIAILFVSRLVVSSLKPRHTVQLADHSS